ncbi:MAG: hypothetical protein NC925_03950, partial [Candidatus Omnitrophica bacterium]|nr:hypothetical protein [Candidatus Omnitrophota bacterium]
MRKLIVHIGAHKTGSSSIQKFFYDYSAYFRENFNLLYPNDRPIVAPYYGYFGHNRLTWFF